MISIERVKTGDTEKYTLTDNASGKTCVLVDAYSHELAIAWLNANTELILQGEDDSRRSPELTEEEFAERMAMLTQGADSSTDTE